MKTKAKCKMQNQYKKETKPKIRKNKNYENEKHFFSQK